MSTLYDLTSDFLQVQQLIEEGHENLEDTLESINIAVEDKLENIAKLIKNIEADVNSFKTEEKRLAERRKSLENRITNLKQYAESNLRAIGERKVKTGLFTFSIQKNAPSVSILDDKLIPKNFYVPVEPKLDKTAIKDVLKSGEIVPGVELKQSESLRIR
jgi:predicted nuclease with TOPRIM domain